MQLLWGLVEFHGRFGYVRVGSYKFRWRKWLQWRSPLMLRYTWKKLHEVETLDSPLREFLRILWPWPRHWPCPPLPAPPRVLLEDGAVEGHVLFEEGFKEIGPQKTKRRYTRDVHVQRQFPLWKRKDTLQRAFFRLYEAMCLADDPMIGYATEYIFFRPEPDWALDLIKDPRTMTSDADMTDAETGRLWTEQEQAERLAVMAWLVVRLVESFNWRLKLGLRRDREEMERHRNDDTPPPFTPVHGPAWVYEITALPETLILSHNKEDLRKPHGVKPQYNVIMNTHRLKTV